MSAEYTVENAREAWDVLNDDTVSEDSKAKVRRWMSKFTQLNPEYTPTVLSKPVSGGPQGLSSEQAMQLVDSPEAAAARSEIDEAEKTRWRKAKHRRAAEVRANKATRTGGTLSGGKIGPIAVPGMEPEYPPDAELQRQFAPEEAAAAKEQDPNAVDETAVTASKIKEYNRPPEFAPPGAGLMSLPEVWKEPSLEQFRQEMVATGIDASQLDEGSSLYRQYADSKYAGAYDKAVAEGRGIRRHEYDQSEGHLEAARDALQAHLPGAALGFEKGLLGPLGMSGLGGIAYEKLSGDKDFRSRMARRREGTHASEVGEVLGTLMPMGIVNKSLQAGSKVARAIPGLSKGGLAAEEAVAGGLANLGLSAAEIGANKFGDYVHEGTAPKISNADVMSLLTSTGVGIGAGAALGGLAQGQARSHVKRRYSTKDEDVAFQEFERRGGETGIVSPLKSSAEMRAVERAARDSNMSVEEYLAQRSEGVSFRHAQKEKLALEKSHSQTESLLKAKARAEDMKRRAEMEALPAGIKEQYGGIGPVELRQGVYPKNTSVALQDALQEIDRLPIDEQPKLRAMVKKVMDEAKLPTEPGVRRMKAADAIAQEEGTYLKGKTRKQSEGAVDEGLGYPKTLEIEEIKRLKAEIKDRKTALQRSEHELEMDKAAARQPSPFDDEPRTNPEGFAGTGGGSPKDRVYLAREKAVGNMRAQLEDAEAQLAGYESELKQALESRGGDPTVMRPKNFSVDDWDTVIRDFQDSVAAYEGNVPASLQRLDKALLADRDQILKGEYSAFRGQQHRDISEQQTLRQRQGLPANPKTFYDKDVPPLKQRLNISEPERRAHQSVVIDVARGGRDPEVRAATWKLFKDTGLEETANATRAVLLKKGLMGKAASADDVLRAGAMAMVSRPIYAVSVVGKHAGYRLDAINRYLLRAERGQDLIYLVKEVRNARTLGAKKALATIDDPEENQLNKADLPVLMEMLDNLKNYKPQQEEEETGT